MTLTINLDIDSKLKLEIF